MARISRPTNGPQGRRRASARLGIGREVFGSFILRRPLAHGGMAVIWLAQDTQNHCEVVLKFLTEELRLQPEAVRELRQEAEKSLRLRHANIVRVQGFVEDGLHAAIVMEYVDGPSLLAVRQQRADGHLEAADVAEWALEICDALDYAHHEAGIVHLDLKPANLLLGSDGRIKLVDFGVARSLTETISRLGKRECALGTLPYMSPQQMDGAQPGVPDDLYALGATLFELLAGSPPFHSGDIYHQATSDSPPRITERRAESGLKGEPIPEHWERAIHACLDKRPERRPQSAGELAAWLRGKLEPPGFGEEAPLSRLFRLFTNR